MGLFRIDKACWGMLLPSLKKQLGLVYGVFFKTLDRNYPWHWEETYLKELFS